MVNESKGKEEQVKQQEGRKKGWRGQPMVSNEIRKWAKEQSMGDGKLNNNYNGGGYNHPGYLKN